ncbi:MAG TPA: MOSC domain-containing protein [Candidatus Methylomirabilis sp.]|nr:MOSC domain-containing protein [Candidatus Methylomirabilis sp.]
MWQGEVVGIYITPGAAQPMRVVAEVRAVTGKGLEGDRYSREVGTYSAKPGPHREVTLIAVEALEAVAREAGIALAAGESRRNIATRGVPLNDLVGQTFRVGEARVRGVRLCPPCQHLEDLTRLPGVMKALVDRGGLRVQVLEDGRIRVGDPIRPETP